MGYFDCKFKMNKGLYGSDLTGRDYKIDNKNINPGDAEWEGLPDRVYFEGEQVYAQGYCQPVGQFWLARNPDTDQYLIRYGNPVVDDAYFILVDINEDEVYSIPEIEGNGNGGNGNGDEEESFADWIEEHQQEVLILGGLGALGLILISR